MPDFPKQLIAALRTAEHVAVLTGAGVSAASGLPTFREAQTGLWARYRPEELATPDAFDIDPRLVWEWYAWRHSLVERAAPNAGHRALAEMAARFSQFTLITQNIDGLHQQAGSQNVVELHGSIRHARCVREGAVRPWPDATHDLPPSCPECGALLRPDVVWFGEPLPPLALAAALDAAAQCAVFLSIGTSGLVEPAASLACQAAQTGAAVAYLNPELPNNAAHGSYYVRGFADEILPALLCAVWPDREALL